MKSVLSYPASNWLLVSGLSRVWSWGGQVFGRWCGDSKVGWVLWTGQSSWLFWRGQPSRMTPGYVLTTGDQHGNTGQVSLAFFLKKKMFAGKCCVGCRCFVSLIHRGQLEFCQHKWRVYGRVQIPPTDECCGTCPCTLKDGSLVLIASQHK